MPAEYEPHDRCLMAWPTSTRRQVWGAFYAHAEASYAAVARAINGFEPVLMVVRPEDAAAARSYCGSEIEVIEMPIDDSWLRDSGPIFLVDNDRHLAATDFEFNSWGGKYLPYDLDATVGERLCRHLGVRRWSAPMVLEGGSVTVDGEGTLITTESCLLHPSRNPLLSKADIEQMLKEYLGVTKVIWLKAGPRRRRRPRHRRPCRRRGFLCRAGAGAAAHGPRPRTTLTTRTWRRTDVAWRPPTPAAASSRSSSST